MNLIGAFSILLISLFFFGSHSLANAEEGNDPQTALAVAKITGACGILDEMIDFQKKTKLDGGNDFVERFWLAESSRQGKTVQQMSDDCNKAVVLYDKLWKSMEPQKQ